MVQAVVSATPTAPDPPANGDFSEKVIDYEPGEFGNGALDADGEFDVFRQEHGQGAFSAECNVVYVALLDTVDGALGFVEDPASKIIVIGQNSWTDHPDRELTDPEDGKGATRQMARVIAHEFGHYLEISTREAGFRTPTGGHDQGKYPSGTAPLMLAGNEGKPGRWIRHEDWKFANQTAKVRNE